MPRLLIGLLNLLISLTVGSSAQAIEVPKRWQEIHPEFGKIRTPTRSEFPSLTEDLFLVDPYAWTALDKDTPCIISMDGADVLFCGPEKSQMDRAQQTLYQKILKSPSKFLTENNLWFGNNTLKAIVVDLYIKSPEFQLSGGDEDDPRRLFIKIPFHFTEQDLQDWAQSTGQKMFVELMEKYIHHVMIFESGLNSEINPNRTLTIRSNCKLTISSTNPIEFIPWNREAEGITESTSLKGKVDVFGKKQGLWEFTNDSEGWTLRQNYQNGFLNGWFQKHSHKHGLVYEGTYKDDQLQGKLEYHGTPLLPSLDEESGIPHATVNFNPPGMAFGPFQGSDSGYATYEDGKLDGPMEITSVTAHYLDYKLASTTEYKTFKAYQNGTIDGPYEKWSDDKLLEKGTYKNGKRNDSWYIAQYMGDKVERLITYKNGEKNGHEFRYISENGAKRYLSYSAYFESGTMDGFQTFFCKNGTIRRQALLVKGKTAPGKSITYHCNGGIETVYTVGENENLSGPYKVYNENGQLIQDGHYSPRFNGFIRRDGEIIYYRNGQPVDGTR